MGFDGKDRALVDWPDIPEIGRWTKHSIDTLIVAKAFSVRQAEFEFEAEEIAA